MNPNELNNPLGFTQCKESQFMECNDGLRSVANKGFGETELFIESKTYFM